jgi:hypothetical protein
MKTRILIMRPDQPHESQEIDLPLEPGLGRLSNILTPLLDGADLEHITVLADFSGGLKFKRADMFVDERGHHKGLEHNEAATSIYRRASLMRDSKQIAEDLPHIVGPAVLFDRIVWF